MQAVHFWLEENVSDAVFFPGCHIQRTLVMVIFIIQIKYYASATKRQSLETQRVCSVASGMSDSVTPWTIACKAPLFMGFFPARILEWIAMLSSRQSF